MESLLQAESTAPKSQRVNYKKASGIQIYAKLRNRLMLNTVSNRYFYSLDYLSYNYCISVHDWNRLQLLRTINSIIGERGVFVCMLHTLKIYLKDWESRRTKLLHCESFYSEIKIKNIFLTLEYKYLQILKL